MTDDEPWLAPRELRAWMALVALVETLPSAVDTQLKRDAGITRFDYMVLAGLSEAPGRRLLMSQLAAFASGSISRLSHAVDRLERQGWVTRRPYENDGRHMEVVLTEAGLAKVVDCAPGHVREARRLVIDRLTTEQVAQLDEIARIIVGGIDPSIFRLLDQGLAGAESVSRT